MVWRGSGTTGRESARTVTSKKLNLLERSYGATDSDTGLMAARTQLYFANGSDIRGMQAKIKLAAFETVGCGGNPDATFVKAELMGRFFNTGPQIEGSAENDVYARIGIVRDSHSSDPANTARIGARVKRCKDSACNASEAMFAHDLGAIEKGQQAVVSLEWDQANHRFFFRRDSQEAVVFSYDADVYPDSAAPSQVDKRVEAYSEVPSCTTTPRPTGYIKATFDDVGIKR